MNFCCPRSDFTDGGHIEWIWFSAVYWNNNFFRNFSTQNAFVGHILILCGANLLILQSNTYGITPPSHSRVFSRVAAGGFRWCMKSSAPTGTSRRAFWWSVSLMSPYNQKSGMVLGLESSSIETYNLNEITFTTSVKADLLLFIFIWKLHGQ